MAWAAFIIPLLCVAFTHVGITQASSHLNPSSCGHPSFGDLSVPPQTTSPPYIITISEDYYIPSGDSITVILQARCPSTAFRGFRLAAVLADPGKYPHAEVGSFDIPPGTQPDCANPNARVQTEDLDRKSLEFHWTPPSLANENGDIVFIATFGRERNVFWENVQSKIIKPRHNILAVFADTFNFMPPLNRGNDDDDDDDDDKIVCPGAFRKDADCGKTKGCFSECVLGNCEVLMSWVPDTDTSAVNITLKAFVGEGNRYVALGLSYDKLMEHDSVTECVRTGTGVNVYNSWNERYSHIRLDEAAQNGLELLSTNFEDGVLTCSFPRSVTGPVERVYNLASTDQYYIFLARGSAAPNFIFMHDQIPFISSTQVSLQNVSVDITSS